MNEKIRGLTKRESEVILKLKEEILRQIGSDVEMILFGSKARGDVHEESDIDILVLVNGKVDYKLTRKIRHIAYDIEREYLDYEPHLQLLVRSKEWWESMKGILSLAINVERDGIGL